ncbi:MAG: lytic murein transglycosylase [Candidatus Liptonbacteria bacterium]|nr:lytic murein transglycosylase [Candidatus Liptonbacteria bacterium]
MAVYAAADVLLILMRTNVNKKPNTVVDILPSQRRMCSKVFGRVSLYPSSRPAPCIASLFRWGVIVVSTLVFTGSPVRAPDLFHVASASPAATEEERKALEVELQNLEQQIDRYEDQIVSYQKQGNTLKGQINQLNDKVSKLNLQIRAVNLSLTQLDQKIDETETNITTTEEKIQLNRGAMRDLLRNIHQNEQLSLLEIFFRQPKLSDFFDDLNSIDLLQDRLRTSLIDAKNLHEQLSEQKTQLSLSRADAATLKRYQESQKSETEQAKRTKNTLLTETKGQESKYQDLLKETKKSASEIRSRLFRLLGGGELTFEEAYNYAKLASGATGVRAALVLAVLDRESALGQNVGRCKYTTAMSPKNQPIFLEITRELGINPESMLVSCPNADGVYGGAMGPAQFVPSTWILYKDKISAVTGNSPASPWNNADAFAATALYLKDAGAANAPTSKEREAAARYYAGSRWSRYLWTYGEAVISRAIKFQDDINTIAG